MSDNYKKAIEKAINQGNERALEEVFTDIYYRYRNLVYFVAARITRQREEAEDITQEVFTRFFNTMKTTEFRNVKYWLVTVARNMAINYVKSKDAAVVRGDVPFLEIGAEKSEVGMIIEKLRRVLTEEEIDIIILKLVFDCSFREIAAEKGITADAAKGKYRRAIKKYKKSAD